MSYTLSDAKHTVEIGVPGRCKSVPCLAVDDGNGQVELVDHAQRDGAAARLSVVHLALEQGHVNVVAIRENLGGARPRRPTSHHGHSKLHLHVWQVTRTTKTTRG